jgi:hypothetical protein
MTDSRQLSLPVASHDEAVALFRYGLIADLLHLPPGHRRLQAQLREKADREYEIPGSARRSNRARGATPGTCAPCRKPSPTSSARSKRPTRRSVWRC